MYPPQLFPMKNQSVVLCFCPGGEFYDEICIDEMPLRQGVLRQKGNTAKRPGKANGLTPLFTVFPIRIYAGFMQAVDPVRDRLKSAKLAEPDSRFIHSRISRKQRFPILVPAACRMVCMAMAVLPCFPITLPISSCATRSSTMVVFSPSVSSTETSPGLSTNDLAIYSIRSLTLGLAARHRKKV